MNDLGKKTIFGFIQVLIVSGVLLFLPAGTFAYWEAWIFLLVFTVSGALVSRYLWKHDPKLLERRMKGGPIAEKEKRQKIIMTFLSLLFILLLVVPALDFRYAWSHAPLIAVIVGDVLIAFGFYSNFLVFRENSFTAAIIEVASDQKVISSGPYAIVRHPMYAGSLIMLLGFPLALGSFWGLLLIPPIIFFIVLRLLNEEKILKKNLAGYAEYCRAVPYRLAPYVF
jgi:protein-S-isoprenylcysteine O-methyltransferase Ste14